jgi:hypothetical protein
LSAGPAARAALLVCALAALAGCGGDDETRTTSGVSSPAKRAPEAIGTGSAGSETTPVATVPRPAGGDRQAIEHTVAELVDASERGDGARVCALTGQPGGAGLAAFRRCAALAGFDATTLPGSDELTIEAVEVEDARATAALVGGVRILLRRAGGRWRVERVHGR